MLADAILAFLGLGPTGMPSVIAPVPHVHDHDRPHAPRAGAGRVTRSRTHGGR